MAQPGRLVGNQTELMGTKRPSPTPLLIALSQFISKIKAVHETSDFPTVFSHRPFVQMKS